MLWTKTFIPTLKEIPQEAETVSHQLLLRAGLVRMLMAGVYSYLPLGLRALNHIEKIIRREMDSCLAAEVLLPAWQPLELWQKSGRDKDLAEIMVRFTDRRGRKVCLGPTHEEVITDLVKNHVASYKQLPLALYQIQTKFRDEIRPRFGLIRGWPGDLSYRSRPRSDGREFFPRIYGAGQGRRRRSFILPRMRAGQGLPGPGRGNGSLPALRRQNGAA